MDNHVSNLTAPRRGCARGSLTRRAARNGLGPPASNPGTSAKFYVGRAVKPEIVMNFSRQTSSFLRAGIPILEALSIVGEESPSKKMIEVLAEVRRMLSAGAGFGDAIALHPKVFPGYYISMVRSAELTGELDDVLDQLAGYMERDINVRRQVKSALTYPTFVMGLAVAAVIVLAAFVLPKFTRLYGSLGAKLPLPTRILLDITSFFTDWWLVLLGAIAVLMAVLYGVIGGSHGKARRDASCFASLRSVVCSTS